LGEEAVKIFTKTQKGGGGAEGKKGKGRSKQLRRKGGGKSWATEGDPTTTRGKKGGTQVSPDHAEK